MGTAAGERIPASVGSKASFQRQSHGRRGMMYEAFYGLHEKPFSILPDPDFLYLSKRHEMAYTLLQYAVESQAGFAVITGEVGCGKTTLLRHLLNELPADVTCIPRSKTA
jgi:type II secretory pathway predicted ATPase ExeA